MRCFHYSGLLLLILIFSCNDEKETAPVLSDQADFNTSMIRLTGLNGQSVNMDQYKGKTFFVNFWATWCKPCLQEMPSIQSAKEILKDEDIVFLFASDETVEQIEGFRTSHDYDFNYVRAENMEELNIMALPTTFIFDKNGKLVFNEMGYRKWDEKTNIDLILNIAKSK